MVNWKGINGSQMRTENVMEGVEGNVLSFQPSSNHKMSKESIGQFSSKAQWDERESKTTDDKLNFTSTSI